uniref:hypothetical protein n=1 Tax=Burkholderia pseudomallei TaxID=28450 RepID=UPI0035E447E7
MQALIPRIVARPFRSIDEQTVLDALRFRQYVDVAMMRGITPPGAASRSSACDASCSSAVSMKSQRALGSTRAWRASPRSSEIASP